MNPLGALKGSALGRLHVIGGWVACAAAESYVIWGVRTRWFACGEESGLELGTRIVGLDEDVVVGKNLEARVASRD